MTAAGRQRRGWFSDDDMAAKVAEMKDLGLTRLVHSSKLATVN